MRIAASIFLIIAAILNLLFSLAYLNSDAASPAVALVGQTGVQSIGILLLVSFPVLLVGAIYLWRVKRAKWVMAAAGLALVCEGLDIYATGMGHMDIPGLAGGAMAMAAALSFPSE